MGPIRADVGVRIPGLQAVGVNADDIYVPNTFFGLPVALAIGIGEAY